MKRKYYLRGLGFGILITTLVYIFTGQTAISDEEVIKRAKELGYVKAEETSDSLGIKELLGTATPDPKNEMQTVVLPEASDTPVPTKTPTPIPTKAVETPVPTPVIDPTLTPTLTPTPASIETPVPTPEISGVIATIVVERGNTASIVCSKIEAAGIVPDANELRDYLVRNNLTDLINIGSYTLSDDMSLKEIADILTGIN